MQQLKEKKEKLIQLINRISKAENVTIETITDDYMEKAEQTTTIRIAWARDYGDEI